MNVAINGFVIFFRLTISDRKIGCLMVHIRVMKIRYVIQVSSNEWRRLSRVEYIREEARMREAECVRELYACKMKHACEKKGNLHSTSAAEKMAALPKVTRRGKSDKGLEQSTRD
ncbi:unnamed protein product [Thelazia callipaeda]|uniref:60S ribosomal protein L19 n=1 Tax=Thelazia callipaeda TaxID=103827 RepID=A0A0N5DCJ3_THECL|nr:unnamed protein product [Thelazia callipaeda]